MHTVFSLILYNVELCIICLLGVLALGVTATLTSRWHACELELVLAASSACCAVTALLLHCGVACIRKQVAMSALLHRDVVLAVVGHTFMR